MNKTFLSTTSAVSGATASTIAGISGNDVLFWVGIAITIATTVVNFIIWARDKFRENDHKNDKGKE